MPRLVPKLTPSKEVKDQTISGVLIGLILAGLALFLTLAIALVRHFWDNAPEMDEVVPYAVLFVAVFCLLWLRQSIAHHPVQVMEAPRREYLDLRAPPPEPAAPEGPDRTNYLPRLRRLLRRQRELGYDLMRDKPNFESTFDRRGPLRRIPAMEQEDKERHWYSKTGDLLLDAFGGDVKARFLGEESDLKRSLDTLEVITDEADVLALREEFKFEAWEPPEWRQDLA